MKNTLEYKGYLGTVEYSNEDNCLYGKIIGIDDLVNYEAQSVEESVEDYLATCKEVNKEPNKKFKGVNYNLLTAVGSVGVFS
jgi:predicted HicB family RNase H-like nuclease